MTVYQLQISVFVMTFTKDETIVVFFLILLIYISFVSRIQCYWFIENGRLKMYFAKKKSFENNIFYFSFL